MSFDPDPAGYRALTGWLAGAVSIAGLALIAWLIYIRWKRGR